MEEIWKPIVGYEGRYEISNHGRVRSFVVDKVNGRIRKNCTSRGYRTVILTDENGKKTALYVHRLVAEAFVPNPLNFREVNHIDENKDNNRADNLEWCTREYNINYGTKNARQSEAMKCNPALSMRICSVDDCGYVEYYDSIGEAERQTGCNHSNIVRTLKGRTNHCGNRQWFYC